MKKLLLTLALTCVAALPAHAQKKYNVTVAGYSPGGLISTIGAGMDAAMAATFPGSTVTYQTSSGGLANAVLVDQGKVPLAFIADTELAVAVAGGPPINKKLANLRMLFRPYAPSSRFQATHVLANKAWAEENGIKTFADIAAKKPKMRVAANRPGNLDGDVSLASLAAIGITEKDVDAWGGQVVRAASREMTSLMLDRRIDVALLGISYKHPRVREMAAGVDLVMLPMTEDVANKVAEDLGAEACSFKADEYDFLAADSASVCVGLLVVVDAGMSDDMAYDLTKGVIDNVDKYKAAHRLLEANVTDETLVSKGKVAFHPGAEKYLREKGLLK